MTEAPYFIHIKIEEGYLQIQKRFDGDNQFSLYSKWLQR